MATVRRIVGLAFVLLVVIWTRIEARALPEGKVTQSGEPSHFQVDDKAAEIEVNANPAGVKVNAKPASLQVVAKPGAPAIPVYHPAIHVAPHYLPPPIIHREPAMYYHHHRHCFPYCLGMSNGWFYSGLRRNKLPKPSKKYDSDGTKRSDLSKKGGKLSRRNGIPQIIELDEDDNSISRIHKSSIPRQHKHKHRGRNARKRQFIAGIPQMYQPMGLGTLGGLGGLGGFGGLGSLGASGYGVQPYASMLRTRAPLARNLISSLGGDPHNNALGSLGIYGANRYSSLAGYSQPLTNNALGSLASQIPSNGLGMYGSMNGNGQFSNFGHQSSNYGLGQRQDDPITKFLQEEINHELYRSAASPSALGLGQGYSRSIINTPYAQPYSGLEGLLPRRGVGSVGGLYGSGGVLGSSGLGYGNGVTDRNPALMQLAQMYGGQLSGMQGLVPGLQQFAQQRTTLPWLPYPNMAAGSRSPMVGRSSVPGSKNIIRKNKDTTNKDEQVESKKNQKKEDDLKKKKMRKKRQTLFEPEDGGAFDLNEVLQEALANEVKRQMILGAPPQPEVQQLAALRDETPQAMRIPLPGLQRLYDAAQEQNVNPILQQQMPFSALGANYISPFDNYEGHEAAAAHLSAMALGRSQLPPDQMRLMPTFPQRMPLMPPRGPIAQYQGPQPLEPTRPNVYVGAPMSFHADYTSPIQYEEMPPRHRRKYGRHPLFRRRLRRPHSRYDDIYDDDDENDGDDYDEDRAMYHAEHLGKERVSLGGSYSENEIPRDQGETLVDTNNHGFGPITVEAKTAEGVRQSLGEDSRSNIAKPEKPEERLEKKSFTRHHRRLHQLRKGVL